MRQQVLQKQHQQEVKEGQVWGGHLHFKINGSKIYAAAYARVPLDQAEEASFGFLNN